MRGGEDTPGPAKSESPSAATKSSTRRFSVSTCRARRASTGSVTAASTEGPRSWTSRSDAAPSIGGRSLARRATRRILAAGVTVPGPGVDQQQRNTRASGSKATGATVRSRKSISSAVDGSPNSEASWSSKPVGRADVFVLGALGDPRLFGAVDTDAGGRRIAPSAAHSSAAEDDRPDPISHVAGDPIAPPGTGWPASRSAHTTPAT